MKKGLVISILIVVVIAGVAIFYLAGETPSLFKKPSLKTSTGKSNNTVISVKSPTSSNSVKTSQKEKGDINNPFTVAIKQSGFQPDSLTIQKGDYIVWRNDTLREKVVMYGSKELMSIKSHKAGEIPFAAIGTYKYTLKDDTKAMVTIVVK